MTQTRIGVLLVVAVLAAGGGFFVDVALTSTGRPTFTPSWFLPTLLVLLGITMIVLALPIRRAITGSSPEPLDPFRAVRILALAKASAIVGAIVAGGGAGLLVFLLTRPVAPSLGSMAAVIATLVGGIVLVAASLITERMCTIGKDDDDEPSGPPESGFGLSHTD